MGFLQQPVVIAILTYLGIGFVLLIGIVALMRSMRQRDKERKRAAIEGQSQVKSESETADEDFDIFMTSSNDQDDYDPLADLYQAGQDDDDDDEEVDLSSLLTTIGEEAVHTVASEQVNVNLSSGETTQARELLSILRDESDGRLMVLAGDTAYRTLLDDPDVKKEFTKIMKELSAIILKPDDAAKPAASSQPKPAPPEPQPKPPAADKPAIKEKMEAKTVAAEDDEPRTIEEEVAATIEEAKQHSDDYVPGDLPNLKLPDNPDNYKQGRYGWVSVEKVDKAPELNIADAIEKYLQYKIGNEPQFQRRGIHIKPAVGGGVRIEADGKSYDFVDEIEDTEVRDFIQTAINEWQDRH